jgi:hypothetical protein
MLIKNLNYFIIYHQFIWIQPEIESLYHQLCYCINEKLWDVEDKLRVLETEKRFEGEFVELARKVYFTNDERFRLKNEINQIHRF